MHVARPALATRVDTGARPVIGTTVPVMRPTHQTPGATPPAVVVRPPVQKPMAEQAPATEPGRIPVQPPTPQRRVVPMEGEMAGPETQPRPLYNKAVPPEPRPSFDAQQKAMESSDPGRPLSPQQLDNLKRSQPAGRPEQVERPHPAAAPRSAPPPARSAPPAAPAKPH